MLWRDLFVLNPKRKKAPDERIDGPDYRLRIRHNPRAKRIALRFDSKTADIVLTIPRLNLREEGLRFAQSRRFWIAQQLSKNRPQNCLKPDQTLHLLGKPYRLETHKGIIAARLSEDGLAIQTSGDTAQFSRRLTKFLKGQALLRAQTKIIYFSEKLGFNGVAVSLMEAKTRWGSCTPARKTIRIHWRLIFADEAVFDYVCAHEVAHLRHPDHSKAFWNCVEALYGDYRISRKWLKDEGNRLQLIC